MEKMYALFSNDSGCRVGKINEDNLFHYDLHEGTENELREEAYEQGYKFIHLFEEKEDDFDQTHYDYLTTTTTGK